MSLFIHGIGTALPAHHAPQSRLADLATGLTALDARQSRRLQALYRRSAIDRRFVSLLTRPLKDGEDPVAAQDFYRPQRQSEDSGPGTRERMERYERDALPLAARAATQALARADRPAGAITHLVTVSCSGFHAPGVDIGLIGALDLPATVQRTHVGFMGCHGALNGLRVAQAIAGSDRDALILTCAVELCSLHFQYGDAPDLLVANSLFADGAAALVGSSRPTDAAEWSIAASGAYLVPDSTDAMTWTIHDHGFSMTLSARVPALIRGHLRPWLERWLAEHNLTLEAVGGWAIHPGGPRILDAVEEALALPPQATAISRQVLRAHGNMSSPTVLFILEAMKRQGVRPPVVAVAFGPGLAVEAMLLR